ncbi:hypothetical protein EDD17DRAFT_1507371 [Pisolithus thermaeus]|nr:hypothetical protein EDD17DRAFT_1507371 [Pisolithus thermaeus]
MRGLYLPAPLPVFTLSGCQCLAQDPKATPHYHHCPPTHKPDIFDHVNEFQFNDEAGPPSGRSALQKQEIQWQQWSQDIIPAPLNPYLWYLQVSESLWVVVDSTVDLQSLENIEISYCACTPAPIFLMDCGLLACSPVAPTLAVDLHVLEFMRMLFVHLTPNMTAWSEALKSFLDAQGYQLESKPLSNKKPGFSQVITHVPIVHYVLVEKQTKNPQNSATHDPPNPTNTLFIPESENSIHHLQGDSFEDGMRVPISVLDGCGDSFHAADEKQKTASTNFFADTGLMALLCHHDHVLWLVNMTSAGEKQHYALVLLKYLLAHLPTTTTVGLLYDIGCQLECSCCKWKLLDEEILSRLKFGISVFHAYGHQWPCQIVYHPWKCVGFGLSDGEGLLIPTQYHQRLFVLDNQIHHFNRKALAALGQWLNKKWTLCKSKKMLALESFHALHIEMQTLQEEWAAQVHSQTQPLPWQSKTKGAKLLAHILSLERSVQEYQSCVDQPEMELINDQHSAEKQKKGALGGSAQVDLYLLRNNKWLQAQTNAQALKVQISECLWQHKLELECLEGSSRTSANASILKKKHYLGAVPPLPIPTKGIFQLDVDSDIWQDAEPGEGSSEPPCWLSDGTVHKGIRLMLEIDWCNEEERRLSREQSVLQEWFSKEWQSLQKALEDTANQGQMEGIGGLVAAGLFQVY